jgi:hypothetical protein
MHSYLLNLAGLLSDSVLNFYIYASLTLAVTGKTLQMHQIIGWVFLWAGFGQVLGRYAKKLSLIY